MQPHQIEAWALQVIDSGNRNQLNEDSRVELKVAWPDPVKAARSPPIRPHEEILQCGPAKYSLTFAEGGLEEDMAEIEITANSLIVRVKGIHKLLALKSQVEVSLEHVVDIEWDPETTRKGSLLCGSGAYDSAPAYRGG